MRSFILLGLLILVSCAQIKVKTIYDPKADYTSYRTWCWLEGCELPYEGPSYLYDSLTIETVGNSIALEMFEKGFTQGDENSDIFVDFHIVVKEDSAIFAMVHEEDLPFWDTKEPEFYHFLRGSLIIHIGDRKTGKMIWRSDARRLMALRPDIKPKEIREGVKKAMKKFPPEF